MKRINQLFILVLFLSAFLGEIPAYAEKDSGNMWSTIETASGTCVFTINLPIDGCLAIIAEINGNYIKEYCGPIRYEVSGFVSHHQLMALVAILFG